MANTYNSQIFADKLTKLTKSQACIQSVSQWCVAHIKYAKEIVETWNRQFHRSACGQRLAFLYLANDILQNSRRRSAKFVTEFWMVLPDSLNDVSEYGDEPTRRETLRLINIWVERSVFGSKSQILKEIYLKREVSRNLRATGSQMKTPERSTLDKIGIAFQAVYGSQRDEDAIFGKCRSTMNIIEGVDKEIKLGRVYGSVRKKLYVQHATLKDCILQLRVVKTWRTHLVSVLRDALQEEEAEEHYKLSESLSWHLISTTASPSVEALLKQSGNYTPQLPSSSKTKAEQSSPLAQKPEENLTLVGAATFSAQLSTPISAPFASDRVVGSSHVHDSANDHPLRKRVRIDTDHHHQPSNIPPPPPTTRQPPLPPTQPFQVPQYPQTAMSIPRSGPSGYGIIGNPPLPPPYPSYSGGFISAPPSNAYYSYSIEGGPYGQPPSQPPPPRALSKIGSGLWYTVYIEVILCVQFSYSLETIIFYFAFLKFIKSKFVFRSVIT